MFLFIILNTSLPQKLWLKYNQISFEKLIWRCFSSFVLCIHMFSKSWIITPLQLTWDYIVLTYCSLDTICFSYAVDHFIRVTSLSHWRLTAPNITAQLNQSWGKNVSTSTVRRRLCEAGIYCRIADKKLLLKKQNNIQMLQLIKVHKDWTTE